jgi:uncharacterized membrane protein YdfJ with MMPL/SSD domain
MTFSVVVIAVWVAWVVIVGVVSKVLIETGKRIERND